MRRVDWGMAALVLAGLANSAAALLAAFCLGVFLGWGGSAAVSWGAP
jgi:hypothetical protein